MALGEVNKSVVLQPRHEQRNTLIRIDGQNVMESNKLDAKTTLYKEQMLASQCMSSKGKSSRPIPQHESSSGSGL